MARIFGAIILLGGLFLASATTAPSAERDNRWHDILQTMQARALLYEDEQLGKLNLGVKVHNRVAILWGPVPSVDMSLRAEIRLRTMIELMDVRNELYLDAEHGTQPIRPNRPATPLFLPDPGQGPAPLVPRDQPAPSILQPPVELIGALK